MKSDTPMTDAVVIHHTLAVTPEYSMLEVHARELERELEKWKRKYYDVADAITRESFGVEDLCAQARAIREERHRYRTELMNIVNAKPHTWGEEADQFQAWAQNRARHALLG